MNYEIDVEEMLGLDATLIDMRSPGEYKNFRIPGAINLPILDDLERHIVGKLYREDKNAAKLLGVEYFAKKMPSYISKIDELLKSKEVVMYCDRGGYRSSVLFSALRSLNIPVRRLRGGIKQYRKYVMENLPVLIEKSEFIVLHGRTGVGKTEILKELDKKGYEVLDLEGLANHRGSSFGAVGLSEQPSQKMFEAMIFDFLKDAKSKIFTEGESMRIGDVLLPKELYKKLSASEKIVITDSLENRVNRIAEEYLKCDKAELVDSIEKLSRYISQEKKSHFLKLLEEDRYHRIIEELMLFYYDPHYAINYSESDPHLMQSADIADEILKISNVDL